MSLVVIHNTREVIEHNDLTEIRHISGWNGGKWNFPVGEDAHLKYRFFFWKESNCEITELTAFKTLTEWGTDDDIGHTYPWKRFVPQFSFKTDIPALTVEYPLTELLKKGTVYYLERSDYVKVETTCQSLF